MQSCDTGICEHFISDRDKPCINASFVFLSSSLGELKTGLSQRAMTTQKSHKDITYPKAYNG